MTRHSRILAGSLRGILWLRVNGKGSFDISPQLQRFASDRMEEGSHHFVVDLESCPAMDSTFMGTLTGIAVQLMDKPEGRLQIVNANERNQQLLENLGLDQIFEVDRDGSAWKEERAMISAELNEHNAESVCGEEAIGKRESCECMIEAHENLSRASQANLPKFRDVIECLKREIKAMPA